MFHSSRFPTHARRALLAPLPVLAALLAAACSSAGDDASSSTADLSSGSQVTLPIEVLGPANTIETATFPIAALPAGGVKTLYLRIHGLGYQTAGSVRINGGAWHALANSNSALTVLGSAAKNGGIGGAYLTLKMNLALAGDEFKAGKNTVDFRFNGTDGRSLGYRVLELNVLDSRGTQLLAQSAFREDDPATWTAPRTSPADIKAGETLWRGAGNTPALEQSPLDHQPILASCSDCHSQDGRDLKYFNYSNKAIIQRAIFHGLSETQGEQLASFVRGNSSPAPGRVWNPPFQPGANADKAPLANWSAGMGIDAVLDDDSDLSTYLPVNAGALLDPTTQGITLKRLNMRETPLPIPLLDWNHWLPLVSPMDALGSVSAWKGTAAYADYEKIRAGLATTDEAARTAYIEQQLFNDAEDWFNDRTTLWDAITTRRGSGSEAAFVDNYNAAVWSAQKMWEIAQEFDLQGVGEQLYGLNGERASWFMSNRFIFDVSPHAINKHSGAPDLTTFQILGDSTLGNGCPKTSNNPDGSCRILLNDYAASNWYDVQLQINPGARRSALPVHEIIDWGYMRNFENTGINTGAAQPMRLARFAQKAMDELDTGLGPDNISWGWNYRDEATQILQIAQAALPGGWSSHPAYSKILTSTVQTWLEKSGVFGAAPWQSVRDTQDEGVNMPPAGYVLGSGTYPDPKNKDASVQTCFIDQLAAQLITLRKLGQPAALTNGMASFGSMLYPNNDWAAWRSVSSSKPAPSAVVASTSGPEQITVRWNAVPGATSYNVKRAVEGEPALTIAYFVSGNSFVDRQVEADKVYSYTVSASYDADLEEGPDSVATRSAAVLTGLVSRWSLGSALVAGASVPDIAGSNPGKVFVTPVGDAYVSIPQNLSRWLGNSATVTAWVQVPSGTQPKEGLSALPGIVGSSRASEPNFAYGILNGHGQVGVAVSSCDGTANGASVFSNVAINDGRWHSVAFTRSAGDGKVQVFVDGALSASGVSGAGACEGISRSVGRIDTRTSNAGWPGLLKDVRIYDSVLSSQAIAQASE